MVADYAHDPRQPLLDSNTEVTCLLCCFRCVCDWLSCALCVCLVGLHCPH